MKPLPVNVLDSIRRPNDERASFAARFEIPFLRFLRARKIFSLTYSVRGEVHHP